MARQILQYNISPILAAAAKWIGECLIEDRSIFCSDSLWNVQLSDEVFSAFIEHPDESNNDFMTKLKGQMRGASAPTKQLMAEMLWALLLFPSNIRARTKRKQIRDIWGLSGKILGEDHSMLADEVLVGIGSGGPGFNNYRPHELQYLILLVQNLKRKDESERKRIFADYDAFMEWIESAPRNGNRQFRHMLRFFSFPDRVERISSNNDRRKILKSFGSGSAREVAEWSDRQLDDKLMALRTRLQEEQPSDVLDFYESPLRERWTGEQIIKTVEGEIAVSVPRDEDELEDKEIAPIDAKSFEPRQSIHVQAKLARIGAVMGFKIWIPRSDRGRVSEFLADNEKAGLLQELPLSFDDTTIYTIEQIDVLWVRGRAIFRAFEVEQTTAVYSGLLRMADLLALQPNMDIKLHIVAPDERREKVFTEMKRPVFSLLERGPLSRRCTFLSYESIEIMNSLGHLAHTNDGIIADYEERADKDRD